MLSAIFDGADSLTYARHTLRDRLTVQGSILGPRHVVCLEVMNDEVVPNIATEALARAYGLHVLQPNLIVPPGIQQVVSPAAANVATQTAVLVQYEPATHSANWGAERGEIDYLPGFPHDGDDPFPKLPSPIFVDEPLYETHEQVAEILATYFAGMAPRVVSTKPPVADFDGDGTLDAQDSAPYDPTQQ
jgi:hypothetical protein